MRTTLRSLLVATLVVFGSSFSTAQITEVVTAPGGAVTDGAYDGTLASMGCSVHDFSGSAIDVISNVEIATAIDQTWVGDLVIKVVAPDGDVLTVLSRPGFAELADDGEGCCGDSSNLVSSAPISFFDSAPKDAETLGDESTSSLYNICAEDPFNCDYFPNPGAGPGTNFAQFDGEDPDGTWMVCVGDAVAADPTTFVEATVSITGTGGDVCEQELSATLDNPNPAPGDVITFTVTVTNNSPDPAPLNLWLVATGPVNRTVRLGNGTVPGGATVTRDVRLRIPGNAPQGTYNLALNIGQFPDDVCDTVGFTLTVGNAPVVAPAPELTKEQALALERTAPAPQRQEGVAFEVIDGFFAADAAASAPAVAPNPFARQTTITYEVAAAADVRLAVYDVLGREVAVLVDGRQDAGAHAATFDARGLAAGTYVYRLVVGNDVQTGRLTLAY